MRKVFRSVSWAIGIALLALAASTALAQDKKPATVTPTPRNDEWWMNLHKSFLERKQKEPVDLLFLGDSITQGWNNNEVWQRYYGPRRAANFGIGGDRTEHVLWRIQNGEIDGISPKAAVLMIGTNNTGSNSAEEIADGIKAIVAELRSKLPKTKILLLAVFPRGDGSAAQDATESALNPKIGQINERIQSLDDGKMVAYLDIGPKFLAANGKLPKEIMPDYLHLSLKGYRIWADATEPTLWKMMEE